MPRPKSPRFKPRRVISEPSPPPVWLLDGLAIVLVLVGTFIAVALYRPNMTGWVGHWVIAYSGQWLFGKARWVVPVYFYAAALLVVAKSYARHRKRALIGLGASLWAVCITLEMVLVGGSSHWLPEMPAVGGGFLGTVGFLALNKIIGFYGTALGITGLFFISILAILNVGAKDILKWALKIVGGPLKFIAKNRPSPPINSTLLEEEDIEETSEEIIEKEPNETQLERPKPVKESSPKPRSTPAPVTLSGKYELPPLDLLEKGTKLMTNSKERQAENQHNAKLLEEALASFGVKAHVVNITSGPTVTRFELEPGLGVKISKITTLSKDIALKLAAFDVRIEAPIPGKALIGIEVPNKQTDVVTLRALIENSKFYDPNSKLKCAMGLTITGDTILMDLGKMPHILIAGATGSGKSVCVNAIILSILLQATPDEVKFLMIDPKKVELNLYEGIPHLVAPVVTDPQKAAATLKKWALVEMERRYTTFSKAGVKNIEGFNEWVTKATPEQLEEVFGEAPLAPPAKLPYLVVIIDELADLMMVASAEVESTICRLAQMARATGIHLVIATQRPSVNVVTGLIKANVPSRVSFFLQSQIDSRTILDVGGAEKLLGKGDMLYMPVGSGKPTRVQGVWVPEKEVKHVVMFWSSQAEPTYLNEIIDVEPLDSDDTKSSASNNADLDELFDEAKSIVSNTKYASTSYLQRKLRIGYNRAARIMEQLEAQGVVNQYEGEKKARGVM